MTNRSRLILAGMGLLVAGINAQQIAPGWWGAGEGRELAATGYYPAPGGMIGVVNTAGAVATAGHPFFEALGTNGRACVTCHQPADGMSVSAANLQSRWKATGGKDPVFAAIDGSNCPGLAQDRESSHSLLLQRGLFRIPLAWPPRAPDGTMRKPEFTIEVVHDPTGCNSDPVYGLKSRNPTVSVYRRPRPVANMKFVMSSIGSPFNIKTGDLVDADPETGAWMNMDLMADARHPTLKIQATSALADHEQMKIPPTAAQLAKILDFENQIYVAQSYDERGGNLTERGGPDGLGPEAMARETPGLGDNIHTPVFGFFDAWRNPGTGGGTPAVRDFRESVARGSDVFFTRQFWIRDAAQLNSIGLGNPIKRTCSTCHNARMTGMDLAPGYIDLGTNNYPTWTEPSLYSDSSELPVFKITCEPTAPPHPYLGRIIYTTDPGRALISGKCADVGAIVMQQFRGLAARAPYFANGSAKTLRELVDYYDRRFDIKFSEREKVDLIDFLSVL